MSATKERITGGYLRTRIVGGLVVIAGTGYGRGMHDGLRVVRAQFIGDIERLNPTPACVLPEPAPRRMQVADIA